MIVPTRFGLKYAPIPTLALEYEDDANHVVDATGDSVMSLYVYREGDEASDSRPFRKLHVVELPKLTPRSETQEITRQLQHDNRRFLAPEVVSGNQLKRLLDRLVQNLPESEVAKSENEERHVLSRTVESEVEDQEREADERQENKLRSDAVDAAASIEIENVPVQDSAIDLKRSQEDDEVERQPDEAIRITSSKRDENSGSDDRRSVKGEREDDGAEDAEDAEKIKALQREADESDEEIESEELEYFSEDGSDEDSF